MTGLVLDKMVRSCKDVQQIKGQFADGNYCIPLDQSKVFGFLFPILRICVDQCQIKYYFSHVLFSEDRINHNDI